MKINSQNNFTEEKDKENNRKIIGKIKSSVKTKKKKIYGAAFILADILTAFIFSGAAKI